MEEEVYYMESDGFLEVLFWVLRRLGSFLESNGTHGDWDNFGKRYKII
jgi:hypothetical protein